MAKRKADAIPKQGGIRQRIALASSGPSLPSSSSTSIAAPEISPSLASEGIDSHLVSHLLTEWAWGHLSAPKVQKIAYRSWLDQQGLLQSLNLSTGLCHQSLHKLASLGTWGRHPNNAHAELVSYLGEPSTPAPFSKKVPMVCEKVSDAYPIQHRDIELPIYLPHEMFSHLYHNCRTRW